MSVYFCHQVNCPTVAEDRPLNHVDTSWHPLYSILAVVSRHGKNGMVFCCHDEGELMEDIQIEKPVHVETICWHPSKKLLAIGWKSGDIAVCNVHSTEFYEQLSTHHSAVNVLKWTGSGSHLLSADVNGLIILWRLEPKGELHSTPVQKLKISGEITHCVLLDDASKVLQTKFKSPDAVVCIFALKTGHLYLWNSGNKCTEIQDFQSTITHFVYSPEQSLLAALTKTMSLILMTTQNDSFKKLSEVKLGSYGSITSVVWTLPGVLAICSNDALIRFWDTANNDNYAISLSDYVVITDNDPEIVTAISYDNKTGFLAAGTNKGHTFLWKQKETHWHIITYFSSDQSIRSLSWETNKHLLAISHDQTIKIISQHHITSHYNQEISAIQVSSDKVILHSHSTNSTIKLPTDITINGVFVTKNHVAVWNGSMINVYTISFNKSLVNKTGSFQSLANSAAVYEYSIFTVEDGQLVVRSVMGVVKHKVPLNITSNEVHLTLLGNYLVLAISSGIIKMFDLSRREPKLVCSKPISHCVDNFMSLLSAQINSNGTLISFIAKKTSNELVSGLLNHDKDIIKLFDFTQKKQEDNYLKIPSNLPLSIEKEQQALLFQLEGVEIVRICWDGVDPRLMTTEVTNKQDLSKEWYNMSSIVTFFTTNDLNCLIKDISPLPFECQNLIGCTVPFIYSIKECFSPEIGEEGEVKFAIKRSPLRDFVGLEESDTATVKAMLSFSYNSMIGDIDEAFKSIRTIKNRNVWKSLAMMCVKTRRIDIALVCLGYMKNARVAKAVREAQSIPEQDAQLAVLAVHLGMLDMAEDLYKSSGRYDLLNLFYQASGKWQKAIEVAESNDRIHLKSTYYNLAKHSEEVGEIKAAIKNYEKSETHQFEVVRMLIDDADELADYAVQHQDKGVQHYWAEHLECSGDLDNAIQQYELCNDVQSTVRLLLYKGEEERAIKIVEETGDKSAAYHVAKVFAQSEELPRIKRAIKFYTMAQCYTHAITVAQEYGLEVELMNLALLSTREDKIEVAKYFEENSSSKEKSIILYHKAGELSKALELCFEYYQFDILKQISEELTVGSNLEIVQKVAEYFIEQEQFDKAVQILLQSERMTEALDMCLKHNVTITEELAEKLTPTIPENETPEQTEQRLKVLESLADGLTSQGSYHIAAMKYTQTGNKIKGMKALLKSGDTNRIVFFANVSRQKEIYVMAANYLQSLNWRGNPEIMKNIIAFYTKGRALETLANFYDTCAKVEIEEFQNYEKAQGALNEALTVLSKAKSKNPSVLEEKKEFLRKRLEIIRKFGDIRNGYLDNPENSIKQCQELLEEPNVGVALRIGDLYAMIVTHYTLHEDYHKANSYIEEMRKRIPGVNLELYIKSQTLEMINKHLGTSSNGLSAKEMIVTMIASKKW